MTREKIIEYIKRNLVEKKEAVRIDLRGALLFGSWARGTQSPDSDVDLLVVAEDINPKRHRRGGEIARIKRCLPELAVDVLLHTREEVICNFSNHNPLFLDIAEHGIIILDDENLLHHLILETKEYVQARKINRFGDGWVFPAEKGRETFLSRLSNRAFAEAMLKDGERDFEVGEKLTDNGYCDKAVYHFQQSIEKAIKSILIAMGIFQKTHLVGSVLRRVAEERSDIERWKKEVMEIADISESLEPEVSLSRYPGVVNDALWLPFEEYTEDDAKSALANAQKVLMVAKRFYEDWFSTSSKRSE